MAKIELYIIYIYIILYSITFTFRYHKDTRYSKDNLSTHDKQEATATSAANLMNIKEMAMLYTVIGIDEGQFFDDLVEFCELMADAGKIIIIAALDGDFRRKPFGSVLNVIPICEGVVKLNAVCMLCFSDAAFSKRISAETEVELIGGADKYVACCRECFIGAPTTVGVDQTPVKINGLAIMERRELFLVSP